MIPHEVVITIGILVFFGLVAFQPMLADLTKDRAGDIPYIESTVVCAEAIVSCVLGQAISRRRISCKDVLRYLPVGLLRAVEDTLSLVCLNYIDPSLYAVLAQFRLVLTGISSRIFLKEHPNKLQFEAMGTITMSLVAFTVSYHGFGGGDKLGILLASVAVLCKVTASVYLERQVKSDDMPVPLQSATISCGTIVPALAYTFAFDMDQVRDQGLWGGWSLLTLALLALLLAKHWLGNVIVKRWSAVVKYVIHAAAVAGTYALQRIWYGLSWSLVSCMLLGILMLAVYSFAEGKRWQPTASASEASLGEKKSSASEPTVGREKPTASASEPSASQPSCDPNLKAFPETSENKLEV
mmetsp:Transcript_35445/g.89267  ORF Transcript_35445/g.89267 Transcript_35445/m.89267 type:complete len:354 (-) Transcript_35445:214-1275(-)